MLNLFAGSSRPTVDTCLQTGQCTFMATGANYQMQEVYRCVTCNLTDLAGGKGVCSVCAQKCHKGHSLIASGRLNFYCDCNTRGCCAQTVLPPVNASLQITVPGLSISTSAPQPYPPQPYPQPQMFNPYPQPTVVHQEVHHHHIVAPPTMPYQAPQTSCPVCTGKGGIGAFGPCHRGDVHWRRNCSLCNGSGSVPGGFRQCNMCQGKGATGAFGPCTQEDVHFRAVCHVCNGRCYIYDTPSYNPLPQPMPSYPPQPVQHVHVHPHHSVSHVSYTSHVSRPSATCPVCTGKGGIGTFGPCPKGNMHWKRDCPFCNGSGNAMAGSRPCTVCSGKGGLGTFGPCEVGSIHFKSVCTGCHGKCHIY